MPIERLAAVVFAAAVVCGVLVSGGIALPDPWDKLAHFAVFSWLTLLLFDATGMPFVAIAAALAFGAFDEWRQAFMPDRITDAKDFLADACAVLATGTLLFMQRKNICAESSPQ